MAPVSGVLALPAGREVILNHVIERKRFDDLAQSIKDGRFKEQKVSVMLFAWSPCVGFLHCACKVST